MNSPARKASATPRPAAIRGAASAVVSVRAVADPREPTYIASKVSAILPKVASRASPGRAMK